jgi:hypothetical protein
MTDPSPESRSGSQDSMIEDSVDMHALLEFELTRFHPYAVRLATIQRQT